MLGSASEAEDAVQETWIRLSRTDVGGVASLRRWLTTVVARVCLDMLRARTSRREAPLDARLPDPIITRGAWEPESEALLADAVGLALLIVLDTLEPAERLAFVLHDVFGMTFDEIAPIVDRSPVAARQLASRARRRVQRNAPSPDRDLRQQRRVVEAFLAARRPGRRRTGGDLLEGGSVRSDRPGEWQCRSPGATSRRSTLRRDRLHDRQRQDRRDEHPRGPGAPRQARSLGDRTSVNVTSGGHR
jgi:RNA polymerase sigma factor (sigma-70 family)